MVPAMTAVANTGPFLLCISPSCPADEDNKKAGGGRGGNSVTYRSSLNYSAEYPATDTYRCHHYTTSVYTTEVAIQQAAHGFFF